MSETIRTETPATITREVRVDEPRQVIVERAPAKEKDQSLLWIVIAGVVFFGLTQGGGCSGNSIGGSHGGGHGGSVHGHR